MNTDGSLNLFIKYLMCRLAPVLVRVKPSILLGMMEYPAFDGEKSNAIWAGQKEIVMRRLELSYIELKDLTATKQVLFYDAEELWKTINRPAHICFLGKFGYSSCVTLPEFLSRLKTRFNSPKFPHEIGLFLGYPLKDVEGFIEKKKPPLLARGNWQVFENQDKAISLMRLQKRAEKIISTLITNRRNPMKFLRTVGMHFEKLRKAVEIQ